MTTTAIAMILAGIQATQGIVHKIIQGSLHLAGISEYLHSCVRELLLRAHAHSTGNDMRYFMLKDFINRNTSSSAVYSGIRDDARTGYFLLILVNIRKKKVFTLAKMRAYITMDTVFIF
jgi:hypothetical protein